MKNTSVSGTENEKKPRNLLNSETEMEKIWKGKISASTLNNFNLQWITHELITYTPLALHEKNSNIKNNSWNFNLPVW